ncbi:MAG: THUMP domain-containing protein [Desulfurococcaceae archaeon]
MYLITVSGEIPLRTSRTRPKFYRVLLENIGDAVRRGGANVLENKIINAKILIVTDKEALLNISRVFGVHRVARVIDYQFKDLRDLSMWIFENTKDIVKDKKFAIRVKRSGVHSFRSVDVAREAGALLKPLSSGVDLDNPEIELEVEVHGDTAFLYKESLSGPGGLPLGVEGKALVLFSGGFDSPVAAWLMAKRGIQVDFLHYMMGSSQASYYSFMVARKLAQEWLHGYGSKFIVVDFTNVIMEISKKVEWAYRQVILRALMYIISFKLANKMNYDGIVTGESIGQASSQTLKNISSIEAAIKPSLPIFRPLISLDKEEIIKVSRVLGLFDLSSKVTESCAIAPQRVVTSTTPNEIVEQLSKIDHSVIESAASSAKIFYVSKARPEDIILTNDIEIDFIPEDAIVIDARSRPEIGKLPANAIPISKVSPPELPRDKIVIVVCETGSISYLLAKMFRENGVMAYSLKGGLRGYSLSR